MTTEANATEVNKTDHHYAGVFLSKQNSEALNALLEHLEKVSFNKRDKGTRFERLSIDYLTYDRKFQGLFLKVQTYADWAKEYPDLAQDAQDVGIDLVATNNPQFESHTTQDGTPTFTAIQCKFYARNTKVPKSGVDSFSNASDKKYYTGRYIIATNRDWTANVRKNLADKAVPIKIIARNELECSSIDWSAYLRSDQEEIQSITRELRPYQDEAVNRVLTGFKTQDRGKLIMACGTGKTFVSLKIAERQVGQHGFILFLVPSLSLLSQTLTDWKHCSEEPITAFAVCSDIMVGIHSYDSYDITTSAEITYPATTDPEALASQVNRALNPNEQTNAHQGMTVIFSTYQSIDVVAVAQHKYGVPEFDLVVCDEAHRTTGYYMGDISRLSLSMSNPVESSEALHNDPNLEQTYPTSTTSTNDRKSELGIVNENVSIFAFIHNKDYVLAKKRLYMTATPRFFVDKEDSRTDNDMPFDVFSMDDESIYGPTFYTLSFSKAVELGCLVDYKVLVLAVTSDIFESEEEISALNEINCARIVGAVKALNKYGSIEDLLDDPQPIKRAVGFTQVITSSKPEKVASKQFAQNFSKVVDTYVDHIEQEYQLDPTNEALKYEHDFLQNHRYHCECKHIDGHMDAITKSSLLDWLKEEPAEHECKILFNVRCLSEGIDVPSLDAIIFFSPRRSQVDVVQSVGRVMRRAPDKRRGYVILPVVVSDPENLEDTIRNTGEFKSVWQVLCSLKSLHPEIDLFDKKLNKIDDRIQIICLPSLVKQLASKSSNNRALSHIKAPVQSSTQAPTPTQDSTQDTVQSPTQASAQNSVQAPEQGSVQESIKEMRISFGERAMYISEVIKSAVIKKLGSSKSWAVWAEDVANICQNQVNTIEQHLKESPKMQQAFNSFKAELSTTLRSNLSDHDVIDMLSQHIVVKPVLDELFRGFPFTDKNPIAQALTNMLQVLDQDGLIKTNHDLQDFYESVAMRMSNVKTLDDRQKVIVELFDNFFKKAFPKQQEKLGIVYTPVEVVDFINRSVDDILKQEFGKSLAAPDVHILDPFTGTGTFITRMLLNPELIPDADLQRKYTQELHAFEIMPLAYYVASINMESAYVERAKLSADQYVPNNITVLTDTFAEKLQPQSQQELLTSHANHDEGLEGNFKLRESVESHHLWVILGNPPYSAGQTSQNDDNQNTRYPALEGRITETYAAQSSQSNNRNSLYDSYIKAFRWASDKIGDQGVIAFVSNGGWLDSLTADGMRRCLNSEFSTIYVYHLKGNARNSGEKRQKEGGNVFGEGSQTPVAITLLVKKPNANEHCKIFFGSVDDYMNREAKLKQLLDLGSIINAPLQPIIQDEHGDWLNQRRDDFNKFIPLDGRNNKGPAIFSIFSSGVKTNRDCWSYNANRVKIASNFNRCISFYNSQVDDLALLGDNFERSNDPTKVKWDFAQLNDLAKGMHYPSFKDELVVTSIYRPFFKEFFYFDADWVNRRYQMHKLFPFNEAENLTIVIQGKGGKGSFSCCMTDCISCLGFIDNNQCFPRYVYHKDNEEEAHQEKLYGSLLDIIEQSETQQTDVLFNGYVRDDAIKPEGVEHFRQAYPKHAFDINADSVFYYVYGLLHSEEYRTTYANNLKKELPRIPRVATYKEFSKFEQAGRKLADLHVNYEHVKPYEGCNIEIDGPNINYYVSKIRYGKIAGEIGNAAKDKTVIVYNDYITIRDIPLEAQEYVVNRKSALDWLVERCCVNQDKESKIFNDYNDYAQEIGDDKYILNLILRVITVSLESMKIVNNLPKLNIHPWDK